MCTSCDFRRTLLTETSTQASLSISYAATLAVNAVLAANRWYSTGHTHHAEHEDASVRYNPRESKEVYQLWSRVLNPLQFAGYYVLSFL